MRKIFGYAKQVELVATKSGVEIYKWLLSVI
jgi:hypothetical protein